MSSAPQLCAPQHVFKLFSIQFKAVHSGSFSALWYKYSFLEGLEYRAQYFSFNFFSVVEVWFISPFTLQILPIHSFVSFYVTVFKTFL